MKADLTSDEVAQRIGKSRHWVTTAKSRGADFIPAKGAGPDRRRRYYRERDVDAFLLRRLERQRVKTDRTTTVLAAIGAGVRYQFLADLFGVTLSDISQIARDHGVRNRPHRDESFRDVAVAYARKHTFDRAASHFAVSRRALLKWAETRP